MRDKYSGRQGICEVRNETPMMLPDIHKTITLKLCGQWSTRRLCPCQRPSISTTAHKVILGWLLRVVEDITTKSDAAYQRESSNDRLITPAGSFSPMMISSIALARALPSGSDHGAADCTLSQLEDTRKRRGIYRSATAMDF